MSGISKIDRNLLATLIRARGPVSATELATLIGVNRTTIVRVLADFGEDLGCVGATRSTRYLMRRQIRQAGNQWPLYRIDPTGQAREWAQLEAYENRGWRITWAGEAPTWARIFTDKHGLWSGFPFFLSDMRAQGFLGRLTAKKLGPMLHLPEDIQRWSDDDVLVYLEAVGSDAPGDVILGERALKQALDAQADPMWISKQDVATAYPALAKDIARQPPGSSAGGEQPKFTATLRTADQALESVLVKFTAPMELETGRRWADLLVCEFHAHEVLAEAGLANRGARLIDAGGRRFLEIPRFDRVAGNGRRGVVSLEALSAASIGLRHDWRNAALDLEKSGLIDDTALSNIFVLQAFGELIGNSDMHPGNLAFYLDDPSPLRVAPVYDMLPMLWAPGPQGEMPERSFTPSRPIPAMAAAFSQAAPMAKEFWQRIANDPRISKPFSKIAAQAREGLIGFS